MLISWEERVFASVKRLALKCLVTVLVFVTVVDNCRLHETLYDNCKWISVCRLVNLLYIDETFGRLAGDRLCLNLQRVFLLFFFNVEFQYVYCCYCVHCCCFRYLVWIVTHCAVQIRCRYSGRRL